MSLTSCPECGGQVSTHASSCPHCGFPLTAPATPQGAPRREGAAPKGAKPRRGRGCFLVGAGALVLVVVWLFLPDGASPPAGGGGGSDGASARGASADAYWLPMQQAMAFRSALAFEGLEAGLGLATPDAQAQLRALDTTLWTDVKSAAGWSYLMNTAVLVAGGAPEPGPLVAFYSPWCDVYLLTEWAEAGGGWRIRDVDLLLGDWVRSAGEEQVTLGEKPLWLRAPEPGPEALARATAASVLSFEQHFPRDRSAAGWRAALRATEAEAVETVSHRGAALVFFEAMIGLTEYRRWAEGTEPRERAVAASVDSIVRMAAAGAWSDVVTAAPETTPVMAKALTEYFRDTSVALAAVHALPGTDATTVFLVAPESAEFALALRYGVSDSGAELREVTFIPYQGIYRAVTSPPPGEGTEP